MPTLEETIKEYKAIKNIKIRLENELRNNMSVAGLVKINEIALAMMKYRELTGCSIADAKEYVDTMKKLNNPHKNIPINTLSKVLKRALEREAQH